MYCKPLFQRHNDPDHYAVVTGVAAFMQVDQSVYVARPNVPAFSESNQIVVGKFTQGLIRLHPQSKGQTKAVLAFIDGFSRKETLESFFEKPLNICPYYNSVLKLPIVYKHSFLKNILNYHR